MSLTDDSNDSIDKSLTHENCIIRSHDTSYDSDDFSHMSPLAVIESGSEIFNGEDDNSKQLDNAEPSVISVDVKNAFVLVVGLLNKVERYFKSPSEHEVEALKQQVTLVKTILLDSSENFGFEHVINSNFIPLKDGAAGERENEEANVGMKEDKQDDNKSTVKANKTRMSSRYSNCFQHLKQNDSLLKVTHDLRKNLFQEPNDRACKVDVSMPQKKSKQKLRTITDIKETKKKDTGKKIKDQGNVMTKQTSKTALKESGTIETDEGVDYVINGQRVENTKKITRHSTRIQNLVKSDTFSKFSYRDSTRIRSSLQNSQRREYSFYNDRLNQTVQKLQMKISETNPKDKIAQRQRNRTDKKLQESISKIEKKVPGVVNNKKVNQRQSVTGINAKSKDSPKKANRNTEKLTSGPVDTKKIPFDNETMNDEVVENIKVATRRSDRIRKLEKSEVYGGQKRRPKSLPQQPSKRAKYSFYNDRLNQTVSRIKSPGNKTVSSQKGNLKALSKKQIRRLSEDFPVGLKSDRLGQKNLNSTDSISNPSTNEKPVTVRKKKLYSPEVWLESFSSAMLQ